MDPKRFANDPAEGELVDPDALEQRCDAAEIIGEQLSEHPDPEVRREGRRIIGEVAKGRMIAEEMREGDEFAENPEYEDEDDEEDDE